MKARKPSARPATYRPGRAGACLLIAALAGTSGLYPARHALAQVGDPATTLPAPPAGAEPGGAEPRGAEPGGAAPRLPEGSTSAVSGAAELELKGRPVVNVRVIGNNQVSAAVILNQTRTREGTAFDPATVAEDYQRIYNLRKFSNVEARVEPTAGGVNVVFVVTEQKQIKSIKFRGNTRVDDKTLASVVDIKAGEAIDPFRLARARAALESTYRDKNFPLAHVTLDQAALVRTGDVVFDIVEGPHTRVRRIAFKGANSFTEDKLRDQIKTGYYVFIFSSGKYDPGQVEADVASLRRFYESKGFFDVRVGRRLVWSPDLSELEIDFVVDEGPRYVVDKLVFQHNAKATDAELRARLKMVEGRAYDSELEQRDVREMVRVYSDKRLGYIYLPNSTDPDYMRIEPKQVFRTKAGRVEVIYDIHEGRQFHVGNIYVKGNGRSQDKLVLREFHDFQPGQLFNASELTDTTDRLRKLPYFQNVSITPIGDEPNVRNVLVDVQEQHTASFNVGAGVNSNGGIGGNVTYEQRNFDVANLPATWKDVFSDRAFIGAGQDFRASIEPGTQQTDASLRLSEPYLFDQPIGASDELYLRQVYRENYIDRRIGDTLTLSYRFNYELTAAVSLRAEQVKIYGIDQPLSIRAPEIVAAQGHHSLTSAALSLRYDTTNPGLFQYRGVILQGRWEPYGVFGGDYSFQKYNLLFDWFQTVHEDLLDRKTVLAFRGNLGVITGNSVFFERFYGGGIGSLRGFEFRRVSPRSGLANDPVGGDFLATGTVEVNFPVIGESLRGVVFSDFGDVEPNVELRTVRVAVGAGVRVILPFLGQTPIAVDFGIPVVKQKNDRTQVVSFSFGLIQ